MTLRRLLTAAVLAAVLAATGAALLAQPWTEQGDARGFPRRGGQVTRGEQAMETITGTTGPGDRLDAYCMRIVEPASFLATTDPAISGAAGADFDTRLFLFRPDGSPALANDDTAGGGSNLSTLSGTATDGSGYVLTKPGEYYLIVTGAPARPRDSANEDLFAVTSGLDEVHAPDLAVGRWEHWTVPPATGGGAYTVALDGVEPCYGDLDMFTTGGLEEMDLCTAGQSGLTCRRVQGRWASDVELGYLDGDRHLDAVTGQFAWPFYNGPALACLGDGLGGFSCSPVHELVGHGNDLALGDLNADEIPDVVYGGWPAKVCLGRGDGSFDCSELVGGDGLKTPDLGYFDADRHLDLIFSHTPADRPILCLGDGQGAFDCGSLMEFPSCSSSCPSAVVDYFDADGHLDIATAGTGAGDDKLCLGDGGGSFSCDSVQLASGVGGRSAYIDDDQIADLFVIDRGNADEIHSCLTALNGTFSCTVASPYAGEHAAGYVDGDSHLDLYVADWDEWLLCTGRGDGTFGCEQIPVADSGQSLIRLGDFAPTRFFADGFESGDTGAWSSVAEQGEE